MLRPASSRATLDGTAIAEKAMMGHEVLYLLGEEVCQNENVDIAALFDTSRAPVGRGVATGDAKTWVTAVRPRISSADRSSW